MNKHKIRNKILIIGGFHKAISLSHSLLEKGYQVTVINKEYQDCEKLAESPKLKVIYGDGSKRFVLEDAAVEEHSVAIALTESDETNLIICELCKNIYHVPKTVALLNDPSKTDFFYEMGIDRVVCALNMITNIMEEEAIMDEMTKMIPLEEGRIHIVELTIPKDAPIIGKRLWELDLPKEIIIGCVLRGDVSLIPRGDTRLMARDNLLIIASEKTKIQQVRETILNV